MNDPHERFRELAALAHYGELDPDEAAALEEHRARCAPCRALGAALERDLGMPAAIDDLAPGWLAALRARVADEERAAPRLDDRRTGSAGSAAPRAWRGFGAGLAAGLAASWLAFLAWRASVAPRAAPAPAPGAPALVASAAFARADPPPRASSPGPFAQIAALRGR